MAQPLRQLLIGILLVSVSSAAAIDGIAHAEPLVAAVGLGVLAVIFANEVLEKVWQAPLCVPRRWWRRRADAAQRDRGRAQQREQLARIAPVIAGADFPSWEAFYRDDARRRAKEVMLGNLLDGECYWHIVWFPTTTEVIAWPFRWRDEALHMTVVGRTHLGTTFPSGTALGPAALPEAIYLVGTVMSAQEGERRITSASSLEAVRDALAET